MSKDKVHDKEETKNGDLGNTKNQDNDTDDEDELSQSRAPPSINIMSSAHPHKRKVKTIWSEICDFLIFCYEFLLIMAIIGSGSLLPSIPDSIYVFLSIAYLGIQIIVQDTKTCNMMCTVLMGLCLATSVVFLIFKIIFAILIRSESVKFSRNLYRGLGIAIEPGDLDAWDVFKTFIPDITAIIVSLVLFIS